MQFLNIFLLHIASILDIIIYTSIYSKGEVLMQYRIIGKDERANMVFVQILTYSNLSRHELEEIALKIKMDSEYSHYNKFKFVNLNLFKIVIDL